MISWHPYQRGSRRWTVYWQKQPAVKPDRSVWYFELTEPYCLDREEWREVQLWLLQNLTPPDHTLNLSQLWWRNWPTEASSRYTRLEEVYELPANSSQECYKQEGLGRSEGYYWVMTALLPTSKALSDVFWHHGVDFETIGWVTTQPIQPFPGQLFEFNKVALGWHNREVSPGLLNEIVCRETWGLYVVDRGHLLLRIPTDRLSFEQLTNLLQTAATKFQLDLSTIPSEERPHRPSFGGGLVAATTNLVISGWGKLRGQASQVHS